MLVVLMNYYASIVTSFMTVFKLTPIINSLEELAANPNLQLTIELDTVLSKRIMVTRPLRLSIFIDYFILIIH